MTQHIQDAWMTWWAMHPEADEATFHAGWNTAVRNANEIAQDYARTLGRRVIDVFEEADDDALAEEVMQDVFTAIGLVESFMGPQR